MKVIDVEGNKVFVDDEDYIFIICLFNLRMNGKYVYCTVKKKYKKMGLRSLSLQKVLMLPERTGKYIVVDHKDGDTLNNQKDNLRVCTHPENMKNRKPSTTYMGKPVTSLFKGVYWNTMHLSWGVVITVDGVRHNKGVYNNELAAANCYNYWAKEYFKDFAKLNVCDFMDFDEWNKYRILKNKTSKYRGVSKIRDEWTVQICHKGKNFKTKGYESEEKAALAYNEIAIRLKGDRARLNNIKGDIINDN